MKSIDRALYISVNKLSLVEYPQTDDRALYDDWLDPDTQIGYNVIFIDMFGDFHARKIRQRFFAMIHSISINCCYEGSSK
ncbi:MAG: hypothetical protein GX303_07240 [Clostridiales bacterium]|nr:hypothetical protein [Clostridiales bacterium]